MRSLGVLSIVAALLVTGCEQETPGLGGTGFPGLSAGPGGVQLPGMSVGPGGVVMPGMSVGPGGVVMPGMSVGPGGVQVPGMPGGTVYPGTTVPVLTAAPAAGVPASFGVPECDAYAAAACSCANASVRATVCAAAVTQFQAWSAALQAAPTSRDTIVQGCTTATTALQLTCGGS